MRLTFRKSFEFDTVLSSEKIFAGGQKFISMRKDYTRVIYDRVVVLNRENYFEIAAFLNFE